MFFHQISTKLLYIKKTIYNVLTAMLSPENFNVCFEEKYSPITNKAISYINSRLSLQFLSVKLIAENLFVSEATLSKHFKEELGISLKKYIDDRIFFTAEKLLLKTDWSLGKISKILGFCDQFYFTRRFRQRYNCTPSEYKKNQSSIL